MKANGVPEPAYTSDREDGAKMLTRIPPAATPSTTFPVYSGPPSSVYGYEPEGRNRLISTLWRRPWIARPSSTSWRVFQ